MEKIKISGVNEEVIKEVMPNGLSVYLLPNKNVKNYYITFNTKFGSLYTEFKKDNEKSYNKIPNGVAHFLEHLTFKMENGEDASDYFANLGSSSNAYTSFRVTCYEVFSYDKFKENLNTLLDFVQKPCYNSKMVEAEKGIICEEVKMYDDRPESNLLFDLFKNMLHNDNCKTQIAGTVKDVKSTTLKDIEVAYNTFYHPSNMFVIITGNFNPEEALAIIEENQAKKEFDPKFDIKIKKVAEPTSIVNEYFEKDTNIEIPKVNIGIKIPLTTFKSLNLTDIEQRVYVNIITNSMFGRSSILKERLVSGNIVTDGIYISRFYTDDYLIISIVAETPYPKRYISIMKEEIKNIHIDENDLIRKKRVAISNLIMGFDDIEMISTSIQSDIINYGKIIPNIYDIYNKLNIETARKVANKLNNKNVSIVVFNKKEKK